MRSRFAGALPRAFWKPIATPSKLVLAVGLPGSGKPTYLASLGVNAISSDAIRRLLADDETDQSIHARVFATIRYLAGQRLALNRPATYVDATHVTRAARRPYIQLARRYHCQLHALFFDVPLEVCLARNQMRPRIVPAKAIEEMARQLEPPTRAEGFSRILRITA